MALEITWLGRTCFRLKGREGTVLTDPCPPVSGYKIGKVECDVATVSRIDDPDFNYVEAVKDGGKVLNTPGEFEVRGILVTGIAMKRGEGERNIAFIIELDGIRVGHLGVPPATLTAAQLDGIKGVDILLLPVGGGGQLSIVAAVAADLMTTIDPRIAIPMLYKTDVETLDIDPLDRFLKETGVRPEPQPRFQSTKTQLPSELSIVVLQARQ